MTTEKNPEPGEAPAFDPFGRNVAPEGGDQHVLAPAVHVQEAVLVDRAEVAAEEAGPHLGHAGLVGDEAAEAERSRIQEAHQEQMNDLKEDFEKDRKATSEEYNAKLQAEKKSAEASQESVSSTTTQSGKLSSSRLPKASNLRKGILNPNEIHNP